MLQISLVWLEQWWTVANPDSINFIFVEDSFELGEETGGRRGCGIELGSSMYLCSISSPVLSQHSGMMLRDVSFEGSDSEVSNVEYSDPYNTLNTRN